MKKAFTMLELVFVIVIIGILSTFISPNFQRDFLSEAANQLVSHIRYTQHLAMMDNRFDATDKYWFMGRWQLIFGKSSSGTKNSDNEYAYSIFSDSGSYAGNPGISELAKSPLNRTQLMSGGFSNVIDWEEARAMRKLNIGKTYGIKDVKFVGCGAQNARRIAFDHIGRPIIGNMAADKNPLTGNRPYKAGSVSRSPLRTTCEIQLCTSNSCTTANRNEIIKIVIEPETGYTHIL